jgi:hypothetical protein
MITRMIVSTVATLFVASIAFSQMKYSRPRSAAQSPTPTPTPSATPQQRIMPTSAQVRANPSSTPLPRTKQATTQGKATPIAAQNQPKQMPPTRTTAVSIQPKATSAPAQAQMKQMYGPPPAPMQPTPTPVPPPDVKAYLDRQLANSKDKKFHMTVNGKDLAITPFHVWAQKSTGPNSTSTCIDMKSDDGRIYDIDFVTTGPQVTAIKIHKINGEALR